MHVIQCFDDVPPLLVSSALTAAVLNSIRPASLLFVAPELFFLHHVFAVPKLNTAIRGAEIPTSSRTRTFLKWVKVRVSSEWGGFGMEGFPNSLFGIAGSLKKKGKLRHYD